MTRNELHATLTRHMEEHPDADFTIHSRVDGREPTDILIGDEFVAIFNDQAVHPYVVLLFRVSAAHCVYCYQPTAKPIHCAQCGTGDGNAQLSQQPPLLLGDMPREFQPRDGLARRVRRPEDTALRVRF